MKHIPEEIVEDARRGGAPAVERLMEAAWPDAYRLAYSILGEAQAAQDAAQESCIAMYQNIASLRSAAAFRVWLYRIVVRAAMDSRRRSMQSEVAAPAPRADSTTSIDVWRALAALPAKLRSVVVLRYFEDLNSREIAAVLRVPDGTVRFRLALARRKLRPLLEEASPYNASPKEARTNAL